jgi:hypothetical protein
VPIAESIKDTYVNFALKMDAPITVPDTRTDQELLEEYENRLVNEYADEGIPDLDKKRTIH